MTQKNWNKVAQEEFENLPKEYQDSWRDLYELRQLHY